MAANGFTPFVGFLSSIIAVRYVEPVEMGAVQSVLLFLPYLSLLNFGAFTGLNRNLAFYLGKDDSVRAMKMVNASAFVAKMNAWIGAVFGIGILLFNVIQPERSWMGCIAAVALTVALICTPYITHISATYRSGQHFKQFGTVTWIANGARSIYAFLPVFFGWVGYVLSLMIQPVIKLFLLKRKEPFPASGSFSLPDIRELIHVGFPVMAYGYLVSLLMVADQTMVALFLGKEQLGYYALARLMTRTMMIIPATLAIVISPKVAGCYGRTGNPQALRKYFWMILGLHVVFIAPVCFGAYYFIDPIVHWLLPKYIAGIGVAKITALTSLCYIFYGLLSTTVAMRKNRVPLIIFSSGLCAMWVAGLALFKFGNPTIESMAWLRLILSWGLSIAILIYTFIETGRPPVKEADHG